MRVNLWDWARTFLPYTTYSLWVMKALEDCGVKIEVQYTMTRDYGYPNPEYYAYLPDDPMVLEALQAEVILRVEAKVERVMVSVPIVYGALNKEQDG